MSFLARNIGQTPIGLLLEILMGFIRILKEIVLGFGGLLLETLIGFV